MPHVPLVVSDGVHKHAFRVLITGFEPFANYKVNPSWLAVRPLSNVLLETTNPTEPISLEHQNVFSLADNSHPIHITVLSVPVTYSAVLSIVPNLHARPPTLPRDDNNLSAFAIGPDPPADGYDLIIHVGAGRRGDIRIEKLGHKFGYDMPDVENRLAPVVEERPRTQGGGLEAAEEFERTRVAAAKNDAELRGFTGVYKPFDEELKTDIDVDALVEELRESGIDQVEASTNAGRYLCDFIYYCSLAEAQRARASRKGKKTQVLFVHCPPVGEPLTTEYVTEALRRIVASVCSQCISSRTSVPSTVY